MSQSLEGEFLTNPDTGHRLFTKSWNQSSDTAKAVAFIVHGYGEHFQHYEDRVIPALIDCRCVVYAHDHFGHGRTGGNLSNMSSAEEFASDLIFHVKQRMSAHSGLPGFLVAHSLGGLISIDAILRDSDLVRGIVMIAPAVVVSRETVSPMRITIGRFVARLCPNVVLGTMDSTKVTRNKEQIQRYNEDPLVFVTMRAKFGIQVLTLQENLEKRLHEIQVPMLLLHGTADQLTDVAGSRLLMEKASSADKKLEEFPDAFHQLHYEPEGIAEKTINMMCEWITERV